MTENITRVVLQWGHEHLTAPVRAYASHGSVSLQAQLAAIGHDIRPWQSPLKAPTETATDCRMSISLSKASALSLRYFVINQFSNHNLYIIRHTQIASVVLRVMYIQCSITLQTNAGDREATEFGNKLFALGNQSFDCFFYNDEVYLTRSTGCRIAFVHLVFWPSFAVGVFVIVVATLAVRHLVRRQSTVGHVERLGSCSTILSVPLNISGLMDLASELAIESAEFDDRTQTAFEMTDDLTEFHATK